MNHKTLVPAGMLVGFLVLACHPRPVDDLVLAEVAVRSAQKVKADSLSPDLFRKAENHYLRAKKDYQEGYYDSCRKNANEARMLAERAEYGALLKQTQIKDRTSEDDFLSSQPDSQGGN